MQFLGTYCLRILRPLVFACVSEVERKRTAVQPRMWGLTPINVCLLYFYDTFYLRKSSSSGAVGERGDGRQEDVGWTGLWGGRGNSAGGLKRDWKVQEKGFITHEWNMATFRVDECVCTCCRRRGFQNRCVKNETCKGVFGNVRIYLFVLSHKVMLFIVTQLNPNESRWFGNRLVFAANYHTIYSILGWYQTKLLKRSRKV